MINLTRTLTPPITIPPSSYSVLSTESTVKLGSIVMTTANPEFTGSFLTRPNEQSSSTTSSFTLPPSSFVPTNQNPATKHELVRADPQPIATAN